MTQIKIDPHFFHKDVIGNVRKAQEDSHDIALDTPNGDVFVVCDGMGGHVGGKQASSIAVKSIIEYLSIELYSNPKDALNGALQFANMQILGYANTHPELKGMGTTACIVLIQAHDVYIAHVGDSRIYLYLGKEKQLHRITKDHSFVQTLVDAGQISDEEAEHHPNKNRILKALGIGTKLEPTINCVHPKRQDAFIICSDGLSGMVPDRFIEGIMSKNISLHEKGDELINMALAKGGLDNITLEIIEIAKSPHAHSSFTSFNPKTSETYRQQKKRKHINITPFAILSSVIIILFIIGVFLIFHQDKTKEANHEIDSIRKEIEQLQEKKNQLTQDLNKASKAVNDVSELLDQTQAHESNLNTKLSELTKKEQAISASRDSLSTAIDRLNARIIQLEQKKAEQK